MQEQVRGRWRKLNQLVRIAAPAMMLAGLLSVVSLGDLPAGAVSPAQINWTKLSPATSPTARFGATMAYDPATGDMVLFGGYNAGYLADTWTWNGTTWTKLSPATSPTARYGAAMAYDPATGNMVLFGGAGKSGYLADTWTWNGTT